MSLPRGYVLSRDGPHCLHRGRVELPGRRGGTARVATSRRDGLSVCPGLIDMHTHGIMDVSFMDSDVPAMVRGLSATRATG